MEMLEMTDFLIKSGRRVPARDMSPYDGKPFRASCTVCGSFLAIQSLACCLYFPLS